MSDTETVPSFAEMPLAPAVIKAVQDVGYETPSPIQAQSIPHLLEGKDLLGLAQTGTGKTAAFALPLLSRVDVKKRHPQVLVLAPTRELAIQVAEAFQRYARHMPGFHVLPVYGGQDMRGQLRGLQRGAQVIVGTPGRVMDHPASWFHETGRPESGCSGRSRRNAAHGLCRRYRMDHGTDSKRPSGGPVLRDYASPDPQDC